MRHLDAPALAAWLSDPDLAPPQLLDVREPWETALGTLPGSLCIPMGELPGRLADIDASRPVVCICHHGVRSLHVAAFLARRGCTDVINLSGGIDAWARQVDTTCPLY